MFADFIKKVFVERRHDAAIVWRDRIYSYGWLLEALSQWEARLGAEAIGPGTVAVLEGDFSPAGVALFLALVERGSIVVPLTAVVGVKRAEFIEIASGQVHLAVDGRDDCRIIRLRYSGAHDLYDRLRHAGHPGLVLFSSGSTGTSKAAVHDFVHILEKFKVRRPALRAIPFLLYDHIGGVNTMLYSIANGGCIVTVADRSPAAVLEAVERHRVELLPTSPTFLNLVLLSEAYQGRDLRSLKVITYGTESMPESTLKRVHAVFPGVRLQQTYGLSEVGILRSKSRSSDSLWVKVGGEGFQTRVVDGILHIKADSAMLGYLNAPSPFTEDGWLCTGDIVEVDGEYVRFLGRESEIINVGGQKVHPSEVENVVQTMDNVLEVVAHGDKHPIMGSVVSVKVRLLHPEDSGVFLRRLRQYCSQRLESFKLPVRAEIVDHAQHTERFKRLRTDR